jgi:hypothetical protein
MVERCQVLTRFPFPQQGNNLERFSFDIAWTTVASRETKFASLKTPRFRLPFIFNGLNGGLNHFGCFSRPFFIIDEWNRCQVTRLNPWNSVDRVVIGFSHIFQETVYDSDDKFR